MQLVLSLNPGGTERLVIEICKRLIDRVDSVVCCLDERGEWAAELEAIDIPVIALRRQPGFQPALSRDIARLIKAHRIDVIHCHHYSPYVYGLLASLPTHTHIVFTEHGRLSNHGPSHKRRLVNPLLSLLGGQVCAVSADLKRHMVAEGFPARRVQVVYNGIDPARRATASEQRAARALLGVPQDAFVIGTVGRLDPVKNLPVLLQAHAVLLESCPTARLVIIGDGPERRPLESAAAELGIAHAVTFAGYRADVRALMAGFDVYANTSEYEGVSLTILEAMAAGLPVIATPAGGNPEVVIDQETGCLVAGRPRSIADAVARLAGDPRRRRVLGDAGRWRVMRHFSMARMVADYASLYLAWQAPAGAGTAAGEPSAEDSASVGGATRLTV
jgi:L-malate glycosyltransferase